MAGQQEYNDIVKKLKNLTRYDIADYWGGLGHEEIKDEEGAWVKYSDVETIIKKCLT